jgi:tripartite-type tricarboxylate transporter receptor subunit TctC
MTSRWITVLGLIGVAYVLSGGLPSYAQNYPSRVVRMVSPFPAGGVNDTVARIIAERMSKALGQQVIVENRPGAGGNIGTDFVAKAKPDGYTILSGGMGSLVMNPIITKVPYDPIRDFAPVILVAESPNILCVHPSLPVKSVKQLIALAKARPGELNYGSGGVGSNPHLSGALFVKMAKVNIVHIPYRGSILATTDLLAGQVQIAFLPMPVALSHIQNKKLRAIATTGNRRAPALKNVPTLDEEGLKGYEVTPWYGVLAPAHTPPPIVNRLNAEIGKILRNKDLVERLAGYGAEAVGGSPETYEKTLREDIAKWRQVIADAGIKVN